MKMGIISSAQGLFQRVKNFWTMKVIAAVEYD
jgi:hypothetical protein